MPVGAFASAPGVGSGRASGGPVFMRRAWASQDPTGPFYVGRGGWSRPVEEPNPARTKRNSRLVDLAPSKSADKNPASTVAPTTRPCVGVGRAIGAGRYIHDEENYTVITKSYKRIISALKPSGHVGG